MTQFYCDINHVAEALQKRVGPPNEQGQLKVLDIEARTVGLDAEEMRNRNLLSTTNVNQHVCNIRWSGADGELGPIILEIYFHEDELDDTFEFSSTGGNFSRLSKLSKRLAKVEIQLCGSVAKWTMDTRIETLYLPRPDFAEISSKSMSTGFKDGLADREFKYETLAEGLPLKNTT